MTGESTRALTPERQAARVRMQQEAEPRYSPGPCTQAVAAPSPLVPLLIGPPYTQRDRSSPLPNDAPSSLPVAVTHQVQEARPASRQMGRLSAVRATAHEASPSQFHRPSLSSDLATVVCGMSIVHETGPEPASAADAEMAAPPKVAVSERPASSTRSPPVPPETATSASPSSGLAVPNPLPLPSSDAPTAAAPPALPPTAGAPPPPPLLALAHVAARAVAGAPSGHRLATVSGPDAGDIDSLENRSSRVRPATSAT
ncbi:hypothetical protein FRC06_009116 [Ceratobasidium sp. 370]|nr:hypothetical protein FRC06_009116 [Ceratobasidium sp. 370]